jgi:hypothetical protein
MDLAARKQDRLLYVCFYLLLNLSVGLCSLNQVDP